MASQRTLQQGLLLWIAAGVAVFVIAGILGYITRPDPAAGAAGDASAVSAPAHTFEHELEVTATAYNSLPDQTQGNPSIGAWGDHLKPGMKVIAVSRDLIPLGLDHNAQVHIDGLPGVYRVADKMNRRYTKRIDIYMGTDRQAALNWGRRNVTIRW